MLDTSALSPDVKRLFAQIAKQSEQYKNAFHKIDSLVKQFHIDREQMLGELDDTRTTISKSIKRLEKYSMDTVDEFKEKVEITHRLYKELDKIDRLKSDLFDIKEEMKAQSLDISETITDFNMKAEGAVDKALANAKSTFDQSINKEMERIEGRSRRAIAQFDQKQKLHERKLLGIDRDIKAEVRKLTGEIDYVYSSITEIKADIANYFKTLIDKIQYYDQEVPRISSLLDNSIEKYNHKIDAMGGGNFPVESGANSPDLSAFEDEQAGTHSVGKVEGAIDSDFFDFDDEDNRSAKEKKKARKRKKLSTQEIVEDLTDDLDELDAKMQADSGRNISSFIMSIISLLGLLMMMIFMFLGVFK